MRTVKTGVTLREDVLRRIDDLVKRLGYRSRSSVINEALENYISDKMSLLGEGWAIGVVTLVYDHEAGAIEDRLTDIQHEFLDIIISTTHVHIDERSCLETILVKGGISEIRRLIGRLESLRGVKTVRHLLYTLE